MECSLPDFAVHGNSPGKNTVVGCHFLLQGIFPNQGLNLGLLHCRNILYLSSLLSHFFFFFGFKNSKDLIAWGGWGRLGLNGKSLLSQTFFLQNWKLFICKSLYLVVITITWSLHPPRPNLTFIWLVCIPVRIALKKKKKRSSTVFEIFLCTELFAQQWGTAWSWMDDNHVY